MGRCLRRQQSSRELALGYADNNAIGAVSQKGVHVGVWDPDPAWAVGIVIASQSHFGSIDGDGLHRSRFIGVNGVDHCDGFFIECKGKV